MAKRLKLTPSLTRGHSDEIERQLATTYEGMAFFVESRCGAVAVGRTYLFPPLSSGGALVVRP
jgi:hypothetical protein